MSARKLWGVRFDRIPASRMKRPESKAAAYRIVENEVRNWLCGALRSQHLTVYVDERDGRGWQVYERLDLDDLARRDEVVS